MAKGKTVWIAVGTDQYLVNTQEPHWHINGYWDVSNLRTIYICNQIAKELFGSDLPKKECTKKKFVFTGKFVPDRPKKKKTTLKTKKKVVKKKPVKKSKKRPAKKKAARRTPARYHSGNPESARRGYS